MAGLTRARGSAVLHRVFVALATEAIVAALRVDAVACAVAARVQLTFVVVWTTRDTNTTNAENIY